MATREVIVLGAGCFWCIDAVMRRVRGVESVVAGYAGGTTKNPDYEEVSQGIGDHAEVVKVTFDPSMITLETIVEIFLVSHDPTSLDKQGADEGTQYRSVIAFTHDSQRERIAMTLQRAQQWYQKPIVTEVFPLEEFYEAESEHQNYFAQHPAAGYCRVVIEPKLAQVREKYAQYFMG